MANLLIDIGNKVLKAVWADGITLGKIYRYQGEKNTRFILEMLEQERPSKVVVSSSYVLDKAFLNMIEKNCDNLTVIDPQRNTLNEEMKLPAHLGADRVAAVTASRFLFKGKKCCIYDFGTMITMDSLDASGNYVEGFISPGFISRLRSINRYSRNLPLVMAVDTELEEGTLEYSIKEGVESGIMFEIQGRMAENPDCIAVFTGGDSIYFAKRIKNSIFVACNLVLMGLALIAGRNEQNKF